MNNRTGLIEFISFKGRANRFQYLISTLSLFALLYSGVAFWLAVWNHFESQLWVFVFRLFSVAFVGIFAVSWYSLTVRRLHDIGKRWFFAPLIIIPIYNVYILVILYFRDGEKRVNEYGPPINAPVNQ